MLFEDRRNWRAVRSVWHLMKSELTAIALALKSPVPASSMKPIAVSSPYSPSEVDVPLTARSNSDPLM
jgi:hypothetical protein